jgi:lipopolysaccharide transport system ATP-binding protein
LRRRQRGDFWALRDVSLRIDRGTTYGVIGANGSGKSTLLKLLAGVYRPTNGMIEVRGRVSAMLELGAGFHPELSGRDNIYLAGAILGMSRTKIRNSMDAIIEFSEIGDFIDTPLKVYSSGMYVRLAFSLAVTLDPEILIVDEILAVGDEAFQRRCFEHLHDLRRRGVTIVFVTHDAALVQALCHRAVWLDRGVVRAEGEGDAVVAAYLGWLNHAETARLGRATTRPGVLDGDRPIAIAGLNFLDGQGNSSSTATSGEPLTVRLRYAVREKVEAPVFTLAFYTDAGVEVSRVRSTTDELQVGQVDRDGCVDYVFARLPLNPGVYYISAAVVESSSDVNYDVCEHASDLHVQPALGNVLPGLVTLSGSWVVST